MKPRVLHVFNRYRFYGGEQAAVERISEVFRGQGVPFEECFASSEEWERDNAPPRWKQAALSFHNPASLARLRKAHQRLRPDVWLVHNVFPVLSLGVFAEARRLGVPVMFYLHNYSPFSTNGALWAGDRLLPDGLRGSFWPEIRARAWMDSLARTAWKALALRAALRLGWYRDIAAWVAVSRFVKERFVEAGVPAGKVHVLAYPFFPDGEGAPPPLPRGHFLFLGRLSVAKGVCTLLQAWSIVRASAGEGGTPTLVIAGDGELRAEVEAAAAASGGTIQYAGVVNGGRKQELIRGCAAMVVPSLWWDPYPTVVYEAYDQGRAVLAAQSGGLPEAVRDGVSGLLHTPGDAGELARHALSLWNEAGAAVRMGAAGREWLLARSGPDWWWREFEKLLGRALPQRVQHSAERPEDLLACHAQGAE